MTTSWGHRGCREKGPAMQNLRDQLLKKGLINKEQKQQVEHEKRQARKQLQKGQAEELTQAQQRQAYAERLEAQKQADRQRAAEQHKALEAREKRLQLRHVIDYWQVPEERYGAGTKRWYFVAPSGVVKYLYVSEPTALQLGSGALAIVERPDDGDSRYVLVERDAAEVIARVDMSYIRFHNLREE